MILFYKEYNDEDEKSQMKALRSYEASNEHKLAGRVCRQLRSSFKFSFAKTAPDYLFEGNQSWMHPGEALELGDCLKSLKDIKALIQGAFPWFPRHSSADELVTDVKDMRANGLRQLASELEALKVARAQAEATASETVARLVSAFHESLRVHAHYL